jgi:preprotein translocase subunit SecY
MVSAFINCFKIPELRQRLIFTLALLVIVRLGAAIPCPGINPAVLAEYFKSIVDQGGQGDLLGMVNIFSGGALENCAIFSLTIMPYISASIIMQLSVNVIPSLAKMAREEGGKQKISQYTRFGTLLLCLFQGYLLAKGFENPGQLLTGIEPIIQQMGNLVAQPGWMFRFTTVVTLTAGTMLLMWLGEQITDKGIGNGISLVITVGIIARLPAALAVLWGKMTPPAGAAQAALNPLVVVLLLAFLFAVIAGTVMITQAMRKVPVQYARQVRGNKVYGGQSSFLPLKVNYSGVMPIIFASSVLMFPAFFIRTLLPNSETATRIAAAVSGQGMTHYVIYALLVFGFSYFWVAMVFNPTQIADDMKKHGGFIPGVRPGLPTAQFLDFSMTRLTFSGAVFLTLLAILPNIVSGAMRVPMTAATFFGGTSLLILVGVMLDTMRQMETYLLQRHYDGFLKKGKLRGRSFGGQSAAGEALSEKKMFWLLFIVGIIFIGGVVASLILHR